MTADDQFMRRALELARAGIGLVSPNPAVGAVVADAFGNGAGFGAHTYEGIKHAEVLALEQAGARARGGSLFLNLEPCSHQGRTGPCADAIIAAGIKRVVASMQDPNPRVAGAGFAKLRAAGVQVEVGLFEAEAKKLNENFAKYIRHGTPLVTLKAAMSLDGKIAQSASQHRDSYQGTPSESALSLPKGGPQSQAQPPTFRRREEDTDVDAREWITGEAARAHVQQLRHQHDAILVGVGTVIADDPLLTDRSGLPRRRKLLRVILDSSLRLPESSRLVKAAHDDVLVIYSQAHDRRKHKLERLGIWVERIGPAPQGLKPPSLIAASGTAEAVPSRKSPARGHSDPQAEARPDFVAVVRRLGELEITSLLIEGGSRVNAAALASGAVDKLFLYYAPKILGEGSVPFAASQGPQPISQHISTHGAIQARHLQLHQFGEDFAVEGYLRDPYQG